MMLCLCVENFAKYMMHTQLSSIDRFVLGFYCPANNEVMSSQSVNSGTVPEQA